MCRYPRRAGCPSEKRDRSWRRARAGSGVENQPAFDHGQRVLLDENDFEPVGELELLDCGKNVRAKWTRRRWLHVLRVRDVRGESSRRTRRPTPARDARSLSYALRRPRRRCRGGNFAWRGHTTRIARLVDTSRSWASALRSASVTRSKSPSTLFTWFGSWKPSILPPDDQPCRRIRLWSAVRRRTRSAPMRVRDPARAA